MSDFRDQRLKDLLARLDDKACGGHPDHFTPDPIFREAADMIRILDMQMARRGIKPESN